MASKRRDGLLALGALLGVLVGCGSGGMAGQAGAAGNAGPGGATGSGGSGGATGSGGSASTGVVAIAAAHGTACVIVNGGLQCWGDDGTGLIDSGTKGTGKTPLRVTGFGSGVTAVTLGALY